MRACNRFLVAALVSVAICAAAHGDIAISSLTGPVTPAEIRSFKEFVRSLPMPKSNVGNALVYGSAGTTMESLGTMYEVTGDRQFLDLLIRFADNALAVRNDPDTGRVLWTGKRDLVWPNKKEGAADASYSGTENGDVIAHIVFAAVLVLRDKSIQGLTVEGGDPFHFGATYGERARTYVRECDKTIDQFILPWYVDARTHRYHMPDSELYAKIGDRYPGQRNKPVPWNQQMMLSGGFERLAEAHALLGDDATRTSSYDAIVQASIDWFLSDVEKIDVDGHPCYRWTYGVGERPMKHIEDGGHAGYDLLIVRLFSSGRYRLTAEQLLPFANTVRYVMHRPDGTFAWRVDGNAEGKAAPRKAVGATYLYLTDLAPDLYPMLAGPLVDVAKTKAYAAALILRAKHRLASSAATSSANP